MEKYIRDTIFFTENVKSLGLQINSKKKEKMQAVMVSKLFKVSFKLGNF